LSKIFLLNIAYNWTFSPNNRLIYKK
jgi:hypothetical protein